MTPLIPKKMWKRWRFWAFLLIPCAALAFTSLLSPEGWRDPVVKIVAISWSAIFVALSHSARTALFDYARVSQAWTKALESSVGAGLAFLGICLLTAMLFLGMVSLAKADTVPANAYVLAPIAVQEIDDYWPEIPRRSYLGALVEKETCITLTHRMCWNATAKLKTSREEGAGIGQLTRAWTEDGRLRFDALAELKAANPQALQELNWTTVYVRSDLGFRAVLLKLKGCHRQLDILGDFEPMEKLAFCDASYNGGYGGMQNDRKLCNLKPGCNPLVWFGNVETTSGKSRTPWKGYGKSAYEINREHVSGTVPLAPRRGKYIPLLGV